MTHRGALVASQGFGRFTYDATSPEVHADTVFDLASLTKVVATTAIAMLLYERGLLQLDSPVAAILPDFAFAGSSGRSEPDREAVTVRMLLAHSSGLPAYVKLFEIGTHSRRTHPHSTCDPAGRRSRLESRLQRHRIHSARRNSRSPGRRTARCLRAKEIFAPLGMSRTCFNPPAEWKSDIPPTEDDRTFRHSVIQGEVNDENAWVMGGVAGHAGLFAPPSTSPALRMHVARWTPISNPQRSNFVHPPRSFPEGTSRALGWDTPSQPSTSGAHFSPRSFGHLGFTGTSLWIDPDRQLSVTLLTNRTWPDRSSRPFGKFGRCCTTPSSKRCSRSAIL